MPIIMSRVICFFVQMFVLRGASKDGRCVPSSREWPSGAYLCSRCPRRRRKKSFIQKARVLGLAALSWL